MKLYSRILATFLVVIIISTPLVSSAQTSLWESLMARIKSIMTEINLLEQDIAMYQQGQAASVSSAFSPTFTRTLKEGDTGQDVSDLQTYLAQDPTLYPEGKVSGHFGPMTTQAVKRFQERYGLEQTGTVGPQTREKIRTLTQAETLAKTQTSESFGTAEDGTKFKKGEILVKLTPGTPSNNPDAAFKRYGLTKKETISGIDVHIVSVPEGKEEQVRDALAKNPNVEFVELNTAHKPDYTPNDPYYTKAWHLPVMQAPTAWDTAQGEGITVAVCDTGVYVGHPDLAGQTVPGWNTASNTADTSDIHGHGTWVAGVIAANTNNAVGVASVAPKAKLMAMRITNSTDGYAYFSDMSECIIWAADHGARGANLSYGGAAGSGSVASAGQYMMNKTGGVTVVAAANDGTELTYANSPYLMIAAATVSGDTRASYSNYGAFVDIAAPGSGIYTTNRSGGYSSVSGTSFATPNTAATVALAMSLKPTLPPEDIVDIVQRTAKDLGDPGWDKYYGWGRVDAAAAVALTKTTEGPLPDTQAPIVSVSSPANSATISDTVSVSVTATDNKGVSRVELYKNDALFATDTSSPYSFAWNTLDDTNGGYTLSAKAYDAAGNVGTSGTVTVTINNVADVTAPTVSVTSPATGSVLTAKNLVITASARDEVGVAEIVLSLDGAVVGTCTGVTTCTKSILSKKVKVGTHTITTIARDARGNTGTAQTVTFTK